ncbi:MAG: hypothetical protein U9Q92_06350 [archaeon]|nr:hypothetical protein [archaeon]
MHYERYETEISEKYLKKIIRTYPDTVLLGGWAVYLHVNSNFKKARGRNYSGSRDIDLGFHMDTKWDKDHLKNSPFSRITRHLTCEGFEWQGSRLFKNYHTETERELTLEESKKLFTPSIFPLYIDPIVDSIHSQFSATFGFVPIDEPLLRYAFEDKRLRRNKKIFGTAVILPAPALLIATKLNSFPERDKDHKRIKDISDIFALLFYSGETLPSIKDMLFTFYEKTKAKTVVENITNEDISSVASVLGFDFIEIKRVLLELAK